MERGRIAKARSAEGAPTEYHQSEDLFVGAHIEFNSHKFVLIDADEYALRYMEAHPQQVSCLLWLDFIRHVPCSLHIFPSSFFPIPSPPVPSF